MAQGSRQIQSQAQQQVQTLSPQQILVVKLLELPAVELEDRIHAELLENPALEEGKEEKMRVITFFRIEDLESEYVVVTPADVNADEAYVLKYVQDEEGNDSYITIDDDQEFDIVSETYELLMQEEIE